VVTGPLRVAGDERQGGTFSVRVPDGRREELLLERLAATEHDRKAVAYTQAGDYAKAIKERRLAADAWKRIHELAGEEATS
jgi:hypothetical protein